MYIMENETVKVTYKDLLIRGVIQFFFIGILFSIIDDKYVLAYFLKTKTLFQILLFTLLGGLLYSRVTYMIRKKIEQKKGSK